MVCGYLPYGDDKRVAQMIDRPLHFLNQPELTKGNLAISCIAIFILNTLRIAYCSTTLTCLLLKCHIAA